MPIRGEVDGQKGYAHLIRGEWRFIPDVADPAEGVGPFEAMRIGAQGFVRTLPERVSAAFGDEQAQAEVAEVEDLLAPLRARRPYSTGFGESLPSMLIPGGKVVQAGVGAAEGALLDPESPIAGGITGAVSSIVGGAVAERGIRAIRELGGGPLATLARNRIPTTRAQRGNPLAQAIEPAVEAIPFLNTWLRAPARAQQTALNRSAAEGLGFIGRAAREPLTAPQLGLARRAIGTRFDNVAQAMPDTRVPDDIVEQAADLNILGRTERELMDLTGELDGDGWLRLRSALNEEVADLALDGQMPASRQLRMTLNRVDEIIENGIGPDMAAEWGQARQQWRFLTALTKGKAISGEGNVNLASARNALQTIYPNFRTGGDLPGAGRTFGEIMQALDQLPRALQSSGTTERGAALAFLAGGATAVEPLTAVGALGLTGNLVAQGGTQLGAGPTRALARETGLVELVEQALLEIESLSPDDTPDAE